MRLLLDEDSQGKLLARLLRAAGHDVQTVREIELTAHTDAEVFAYARSEERVLLTRNGKDFAPLHEGYPEHPGILVEYQDRDPGKNLSAAEVVRAIGNIAVSGWDISGQFVAINAWNY